MAKEHVKRITSIGGQALIEGVMMRGPQKTSMAVRLPDGSIELQELKTDYIRDKSPVWRLPLIRGIVGFIDSMRVGFRALSLSAEKSGLEEEEEEPSSTVPNMDRKMAAKRGSALLSWSLMKV